MKLFLGTFNPGDYASSRRRPVRFNAKVYEPIKFGDRPQTGTVEWELNRRRERAQERALR